MLHTLKKLVPSFALTGLRNARNALYRMSDLHKPFLNHMRYLGFDLYYSKGYGLVNRIRFGNPDRVYESHICKKLALELQGQKEKLFLDIGANIGLVSLYILRNVQDSKIYAFEPAPHQYE